MLQRLHEGVEQHRGIDGLDEHRLDPLGRGGTHHIFAAIGGDHEHLRHFGHAQAADMPGQLDTIHAGHVPVQQQQAKRALLGHGHSQHIQRLQARMRLLHVKPHGLEHV